MGRFYRHRTKVGLFTSTLFHLALVAVLLWQQIPRVYLVQAATWAREPLELRVTLAEPHRLRQHDARSAVVEASQVDSVLLSSQSISRQQPQPLDEPYSDSGDDADNSLSDQVLGASVRKLVDLATDSASKQSVDDLHQQLSELGSKLEEVSNPQRIERLADRFRGWLQVDDRAAAPTGAERAVASSFDYDTAQVHDVLREPTGDGGFEYIGILVDAQGHSMEVPLNEQEGAELYKTMALIKKFPMLESVYRSVVMSLLDKLTSDGRGLMMN